MPEAYVTLATNDGYAVGALVLAHSLKSVGTTRDLCIMITPAVSEEIKSLLQGVFTSLVTVDVLDSNDPAHLSLLKRPELGVTFTKLRCWTLTQYTKCVFLDADMLAIQNPDDLFSHPELTAVCDIGWPDCFNSGMFVFVPNIDTYGQLLHQSEVDGSFDGGDQGILNTFFPQWLRVSFIYNMVASATYSYLPAYKQFGGNAKIVHFLGALKPWQHKYDRNSGSVHVAPGYQHLAPYLNSWWAIYTRLVQPGVPELNIEVAVHSRAPIEDVKSNSNTVNTEQHKSETWDNSSVDRAIDSSVNGDTQVMDLSHTGHRRLECLKTSVTNDASILIHLYVEGDINNRDCGTDFQFGVSAISGGNEVTQQLGGMSVASVADSSPLEGKERWERGEPDYLGQDSFANIQAYIDAKIKNGK